MSSSAQHEGLVGNGAGRALSSLSSRSALVVYGSETGNAHDVAKEIGHLVERHRFDTTVIDLDAIELKDLVRHDVVIAAISTAGQGEFPQNARLAWQALLSRQLRPGILKRVRFTTFGLGDSSYPKYNVASRMLHGRLVQLGALAFCPRGEGNEQHPEGHNAELRTWMQTLSRCLTEQFPLPDGQIIIAEGEFIEPKWKLVESQESSEQSSDHQFTDHVIPPMDCPDCSVIPIKDAQSANILSNFRLTPSDHEQDVRLLDLSVDKEVSYGPGAVAVIYPKNFPWDVQQFIELMNWENMADRPLELASKIGCNLQFAPSSPLGIVDLAGYGDRCTLRTLLTNHLDIMSVPRRYFFCSLANFAKDATEDDRFQKERLLELGNPELIDELWDYTTRPRRTILEVMQDFTTITIPWQYALSVIPVMRGRQFSIASGGKLKTGVDGHTIIQLLVAIAAPPNPIIKYRKRHGVCTRYITTLEPGQHLSVTVQPGYLNLGPESAEAPMVMIGPGTGVAPLRSLIYERLQWAAHGHGGGRPKWLQDSILFFGCRKPSADYYFQDEWRELTPEHGLVVHTAFSRDNDQPRQYVQDLIRAKAEQVYEALVNKKGMVFVCGSSGEMPKGVRRALVAVLARGNGQEHEVGWAESYLEQMEKSGRYKQETW